MIEFEEKRKVVYIELEPEVHTALRDLASRFGVRLCRAGGQCVADHLAELARRDPKSFKARLFVMAQDARRRREMRAQLRAIAWGYLREENEEGLDELASLCAEAGVPASEILEEAKQHSSPPITYDGGKLAEAIEFLHEIGRVTREYPTSEVLTTGATRGLSEFILKQAKSKIGIASSRRSKHWVWVWPDSSAVN